jgi:hypothetical protein
MNNTPTTNERWKALCLSGKSWYQIAEELDILKNKYANIETTALSLMMENKTVTEQRDRLAEALQDLIESCNCIDSVDFMPVSMPEAFEKAQQALQSLPPKP